MDQPAAVRRRDVDMLREGEARLVTVPELLVPTAVTLEVTRERNQLLWRVDNESRWIAAPPSLLGEFVLLADAPSEAIRDYAEQYGVLFLCPDHRLPAGDLTDHHLPRWRARRNRQLPVRCQPDATVQRGGRMDGVEPVISWRRFALLARALIKVAAELRADREPPDTSAAWMEVILWAQRRQCAFAGVRRGKQHTVAAVVDDWMALGDVRSAFSWPKSGPRVTYAVGGLFGALGLQLMLAVSNVQALVLCSSCGKAYRPRRLPRSGRHYCPACRRRGIPERDAARDYRVRQRRDREGERA